MLWRNRAGVLAFEYEITGLPNITDIAWSNCSSFFFACADTGHVQVVDASDGAVMFALQVVSTTRFSPPTSFTCCCWNHDNSCIAVGTASGEVVELSVTEVGRLTSTTELRQGVPVRSVDSAHDKDGVEGKCMGASSECSGPVCAQASNSSFLAHYKFINVPY